MRKQAIAVVAGCLVAGVAVARTVQVSESFFTDWSTDAKTPGTHTNNDWVIGEGQLFGPGFGYGPHTTPYSCWLQGIDVTTNSWLRSCFLSNGVGKVTYWALNRYYGHWNEFAFEYSTNGTDWTELTRVTTPTLETISWFALTNDFEVADPGWLRWHKTADSRAGMKLGLDDIVIYNPPGVRILGATNAPASPTSDDAVHVTATVDFHHAVTSGDVLLWYRFDGRGPYASRPMGLVTGDVWQTVDAIPAGRAGTVEYYVEARYIGLDNSFVLWPGDAPTTVLSYDVADAGGDTPNPRQFAPCSRRTFLTVSEIMYHPADRVDGLNLEFVELYNSEPVAHDISGYRISGEVSYRFPEGTVVPARDYVVVAADPTAITALYPVSAVFGPYTGALSNGGGTIRVRNAQEAVLLEVEYDDQMPWPIAADGTGHSLVLAKPDYGEGDVRAWAQSERTGGSPGYALPEQTGVLEQLQINEFLAHTDLPQVDFIEVHNYGALAADVTGCILTDDPATNKYVITNGVIAANTFLAFDQNMLGFSLSMSGDDIYLIRPDGKRVLDAVRFEAQTNGLSMGRWPDGAGAFSVLTATTEGSANTNAEMRVEDVVINELMYHPISGDDDDEYVELYNKGTAAADLSNWRFTDGVDLVFPAGTTIPVGGYLVVARNATNLLAKYAQLNATNCVGNYSGQLSDRGERVALSRPDDPELPLQDFVVVDEVTYADGERWGKWADGGGSSLELVDPRADNRWAMNWAGSDETAKAPWTLVEHTGVLDLGQNNINPNQADEIHILLETSGECLVDAVEAFRIGQGNVVPNGSFESGLTGWIIQGTHILSSLETGEAYDGSSSLHICNTAKGDNSVNRIEADLTSYIAAGSTATIRARVRWLAGSQNILLRFHGNWLEAPGRLDVPGNLGTPGADNSRRAQNIGPSISEVVHAPVLPGADQPITVTARIQDPDGVQSAVVKWWDDPDTSTLYTVTMKDDGVDPDDVAGDGLYSAPIPGQPAADHMAFYIEATDALAAVRRFPSDASRECVVFFGQSPVSASAMGVYRFWMTEAVRSTWSTRQKLSDHPLNGTFVYGDWRAVYEAGARYRGSPFIRAAGDPESGDRSFVFYMPKDDRVLGARTFNIDRLEDDDTQQRERLALWMASKVKTPYFNQRYARLYIDEVSKGLFGDSQQPNDDFMLSWWSDAEDGDLYKIDDWFEFDDAAQVSREFNQNGQLVRYLSGSELKKARYRWSWRKEPVDSFDDDYSHFFSMVDAQNQAYTSPEYFSRVAALVDWEEWMQVFAIRHMINDWDSYGYNRGKNMSTYQPDGDRWRMIMWDLDHAHFTGDTSAGLFSINCPTMLGKFFMHPVFRRAYWRSLWTLAYGPMEAVKCGPVMDQTDAALRAEGFSVTSPNSSLKSWIVERRTYLISQLASVAAPFEITTSGGANFDTMSQVVTLSGTAPVEVEEICVNGMAHAVTFSTVTGWQMDVALEPGANVFALQGYLHGGVLYGSAADSITITYDGAAVSPEGKLVINEIMYNAADEYGDYIELCNISGDRLHLGGLRLNGVDFTFDQGTYIEPNGYVVVPENLAAYAYTYTNAEKVAGEYTGSLDNGGETISLLMPVGTNSWVELDRVRYSDSAPWPTDADGLGPSLQLIDAAEDNQRVANWAVSGVVPYTPGAANSVADDLPAFPQVWINELMVDNGSFAQDSAGDYDPWLELFNAESVTVDPSAGFYLTDSYTNLTEWAFPAGWEMNAGAFQTVWTDNETNETTGSELHAGITLASPSGTVALAWFNGSEPVILDYVNYHAIPTNSSLGFYPDGESWDRQIFHYPTPGSANNPTSIVVDVRINEWMARNSSTLADPADADFDDWFELYNAGDTVANLTGYLLTDTLADPDKSVIPFGTILGVGEYRLVWADEEMGQNGGLDLHADFQLSGNGESIRLSAPDLSIVDVVTFSTQLVDIAEGRWPDGSNAIWQMAIPTPRAANVLFVLENVAVPGSNTVDLSWNAVPGREYRLYSTGNLQTNWTPHAEIYMATNGVVSVTVTNEAPTPRYYRVGQEL